MRDSFALSAPQPSSGWGIRFSGRAALVVAIAVAAVVPARAATVTVGLRVGVGGNAGAVRECAVSVAEGADGRAVLTAGVAQRCISSFQTSDGGAYVTCIDFGAGPVCEIADGLVTFWAVYEDGATSTTGIGGFRAAAGKELTFAYTSWLTCAATYPDCPV